MYINLRASLLQTKKEAVLGADVLLFKSDVNIEIVKKKNYIITEPIYMIQQYTSKISIYSNSVMYCSLATFR